MLIYILNVVFIGIYSLLYNLRFKGNSRVRLALITTATLQLVLILGLKNIFIGSDMPNYWAYFDEQLRWSLTALADERFEIGFKALTKAVTSITLNPQIYLLTIATLSVLPIGIVIYKYSKMPFLSIALYIFLGFYSFAFSGLRQAIALGIIFIAYTYLVNKKPFRFTLAVLLAALFHVSALIFLPAYLFKNYRYNPRRLMFFFITAALILFFNTLLLRWLTSVVYQDYSAVATDSFTWMTMAIFIFLACMKFYDRAVGSDVKNIPTYAIVSIGILLMLFAPVADNVMRIANYYFIFVILLIPAALAEIRPQKARLLAVSAVIIVFSGVYTYLLAADSYNTVPYQFFWESTGQYNE